MSKSFYSITSLLVLCVTLAACGGGAKSTPTPTSSESLSPTPAEPVRSEDLERAALLYEEGAVEEATKIYEDAIEDGDDAEREQALWALARVQYQQGDNGKAEDIVEEYLDEQVAPEGERQALLLKGMVELAQGRNDEAEESLKAYVEAGGPAGAYANLRLADLRARKGDKQGAIEQTLATLTEPLPPGVQTDARFSLAAYHQEAGNVTAAIETYELLGLEGEFRVERAEALSRAAGLAIDAGDVERGLRSLRQLLTVYPAQEAALAALDDPRFAPHIGPPSRATVLLEHRVDDQAATAYQAIVDSGDVALAADAHYHLGILAERFANYDGAIAQYDAAIAAAGAMGQGDRIRAGRADRGGC
jgi:hypothetical protein